MTSHPNRLDELLRLVREDLATPEVLSELHGLIATDDRALQDYIRAMHFQASLSWLLDGQAPGSTAVRKEVRRLLARSRRRTFWRVSLTVIAATLLLGVGLLQYFPRSVHDLSIAPVVGAVRVVDGNARWTGYRRGAPGQVVRVGHAFVLEKGLAQFLFAGGAEVNLEGPARLRILGPGHMALDYGKLIADIPPAAIGFTVSTGTAEVVDLGTQFGVQVEQDGTSEFHVLEGQVRAASPQLDSELLSTNQASRYATDGQSRTPIPARPDTFSGCLQLAAGIVDLSGQARYWPDPQQLLGTGAELPQDMIHLFRERERFALPQPLEIVANELPLLTTEIPPVRRTLAAGTVIDSFFLHLSGDRQANAECQVTFARPVLGFVLEPAALTATDALLGLPELRYEPPGRDSSTRGALLPAPTKLETGDRLTVSPDRRTLTFRLAAGKPAYDQIRILVSPAPAPAEVQAADSPRKKSPEMPQSPRGES
jgi:hypothetical protein